MTRGITSILLLVASNSFMTLAWYGHLKFRESESLGRLSLFSVILISWGIAFFEYCLQVPANRIGFVSYGGPYSLVQLKVIQEAITLGVFVVFSVLFFKDQYFTMNHFIGFLLLVLAVYFIFRK